MSTTKAAVQSLWIARWQPTALNELLGHHMAAHRLKKNDQTIVAIEARIANMAHATTRRKVDLHVVLRPGQRACDPDSYWKSTLDALVACKLLRNDSAAWCEPGKVSYGRAATDGTDDWGTVIILTDLGKDTP